MSRPLPTQLEAALDPLQAEPRGIVEDEAWAVRKNVLLIGDLGAHQRFFEGAREDFGAIEDWAVRTVEVHRARMMERLGGRQLTEVIRLGVIARLNASLPRDKRGG